MTRNTTSTVGVIAAVVLRVSAYTAMTSDRAGGRGLDEPMVLEIAQPNDEAPPQGRAYEITESSTGHIDRATFTFDGRTLTLTPVGVCQCDGRVTWTLHPWDPDEEGPMTDQSRVARSTIGVMVAAMMGAPACTAATSDRAGGRGLDVAMVLEIAQPNDVPPPQVQAYAAEVEKLSHGTLSLRLHDQWRKGDVDFERHTLEDVVAGRIAGAWVGIRSLDLVGATSFQPLEAPLLVDSQALQERIFVEHIPDEMARGLDGHGFTVVAVLPGPIRKVLGVHRPFREPADFHGATLGIQDGRVMQATAQALGAMFKRMPTGASLAGVDAYEHHVENIFDSHYGLEAKYLTANVNLWPRSMVVLLGDATNRRLSAAQREILRKAALEVVPTALAATRTQDDADVVKLCGQGLTFPRATDEQLVALRRSVQPVYEQIARVPANGRMLDRLIDLKAAVAVSPDVAACPVPGSEAGVGAFPQGTYDMVLEHSAYASCPEDLRPKRGARTLYRLDVRDGRVTLHERIDSPSAPETVGYDGVYTTLRDRVRIDHLTATWSFDGTALQLSNMTGGSCGDAVVWTRRAWIRRPATTAPSSRSILDGTFETVLSPDDQKRCDGLRDGPSLNPDGHPVTTYFGFTLSSGDLQGFAHHGSRSAPAEHGPQMRVRIYRNIFELTDKDDGHVDTATFTFDGRTLILTATGDSWGCEGRVVWTLHPWTLVRKAS